MNSSFYRHFGLLLGLLTLLVACPDDTKPPPAVNLLPNAAFAVNATVQAGTALAFDASSSSDPDKDTLIFSWDFADGGKGGTAKIAHVFAAAGSFKVALMVSDGKGGTNTLEKTITVSPPPAPSKTLKVQGLVKGIDNLPLSSVNVSVVGGAISSVTGADGKVSLTLGVGVDVTLKLEKAGFTDQIKVINLPNNVGTDGYFEAQLMPREAAQTLLNAAGNLTGKDGVKLTIPDGGLVDSSGKTVTGAVNVTMTPVDVTGAALPAFPGEFEGVNPDGSRSSIVSYGTTEFVLTQGGQKVQVAASKKATLELPIYSNANLDGSSLKAGDKLPLWSLDEQSGAWINEGEGTVVANATSPTGFALKSEVAHFSWWNADIGFDPWGPKPKCVNDVPGQYDNIFAQAQICNMIADMDQGISGNAVSTRQTQPRLPSTRATTTVPIAGGVSLQIPAGVNVILRGSILNGTWQGQITVNEAKGTSKEILIPLKPVTIGGNDETISLPFDQTRVLQPGATNRYTFTAPAGQQLARIIISQAGSSLQGKVRLLQGNTELDSVLYGVSSGKILKTLPGVTQYVVEVTGTSGTPGGYQLQVNLFPETVEDINITPPSDLTRTLQPAQTVRYHFTAAAGQYSQVLLSDVIGSSLTGKIRLLQGSTALKSLDFSSSNGAVIFQKLETPGEYVIEVSSTTDTPEAYRLQTNLADVGNINKLVSVGLNDGESSIYTFAGLNGMLIYFYSTQTDSPGYYGRLYLTDPDGMKVINGSTFALIGMTERLTKDGIYTVELRSVGKSGKYLLTSSLVENPTPLTLNTRIESNDTLMRLGVAKYFSLDLNQGDFAKFIFKVPDTLPGSLEVHYRVGAFPKSQDIVGFNNSIGTYGDLFNDATGRFKISDLLFPPNTQTSHYLMKFESWCLSDCAGYDTSSFPYSYTILRPTPVVLAVDTPTTSSFTEPYGFERYSLNITDAGYYSLYFNPTAPKPSSESDQQSFVLEVFDPTMTRLGNVYRNDPPLMLKLGTGSHTLILNKRYAEAAPYNLSAIRLMPPTPVSLPSGDLNGSINLPAQVRYYSLNRTANQVTNLNLTAQGSWSGCISMYKLVQNGDYTNSLDGLGDRCFGFPGGNGQTVNYSDTAPSNGTYIVRVKGIDQSGHPNQTGSYRLNLTTP